MLNFLRLLLLLLQFLLQLGDFIQEFLVLGIALVLPLFHCLVLLLEDIQFLRQSQGRAFFLPSDAAEKFVGDFVRLRQGGRGFAQLRVQLRVVIQGRVGEPHSGR